MIDTHATVLYFPIFSLEALSTMGEPRRKGFEGSHQVELNAIQKHFCVEL